MQKEEILEELNHTPVIYDYVDLIGTAIHGNRQIFLRTTGAVALSGPKGKTCVISGQVSPWSLVWNNQNYYLLAYDELDAHMICSRVDEILDLDLMDRHRVGQSDFRRYGVQEYDTAYRHFEEDSCAELSADQPIIYLMDANEAGHLCSHMREQKEVAVEHIRSFSQQQRDKQFAVHAANRNVSAIPCRVVTSVRTLREKILIFDEQKDDRIMELIKYFYCANYLMQHPRTKIHDIVYDEGDDGPGVICLMNRNEVLTRTRLEENVYSRVSDILETSGVMCREADPVTDQKWAERFIRHEGRRIYQMIGLCVL